MSLWRLALIDRKMYFEPQCVTGEKNVMIGSSIRCEQVRIRSLTVVSTLAGARRLPQYPATSIKDLVPQTYYQVTRVLKAADVQSTPCCFIRFPPLGIRVPPFVAPGQALFLGFERCCDPRGCTPYTAHYTLYSMSVRLHIFLLHPCDHMTNRYGDRLGDVYGPR